MLSAGQFNDENPKKTNSRDPRIYHYCLLPKNELKKLLGLNYNISIKNTPIRGQGIQKSRSRDPRIYP